MDVEDITRRKIFEAISLIAGFNKKDWVQFNKALNERLETVGKGKRNLEFFQRVMQSYQKAIEKLL